MNSLPYTANPKGLLALRKNPINEKTFRVSFAKEMYGSKGDINVAVRFTQSGTNLPVNRIKFEVTRRGLRQKEAMYFIQKMEVAVSNNFHGKHSRKKKS